MGYEMGRLSHQHISDAQLALHSAACSKTRLGIKIDHQDSVALSG
jgi:hypothetical protein